MCLFPVRIHKMTRQFIILFNRFLQQRNIVNKMWRKERKMDDFVHLKPSDLPLYCTKTLNTFRNYRGIAYCFHLLLCASKNIIRKRLYFENYNRKKEKFDSFRHKSARDELQNNQLGKLSNKKEETFFSRRLLLLLLALLASFSLLGAAVSSAALLGSSFQFGDHLCHVEHHLLT